MGKYLERLRCEVVSYDMEEVIITAALTLFIGILVFLVGKFKEIFRQYELIRNGGQIARIVTKKP